MRVEMPLWISLSIGGPLVEAHRIGKRGLKQIVVANRNAPQNIREEFRFAAGEILHGGKVPLAYQHRFERPYRPERSQYRKTVILTDHALAMLQLEVQIIAEQARLFRFSICPQRSQLFRRQV